MVFFPFMNNLYFVDGRSLFLFVKIALKTTSKWLKSYKKDLSFYSYYTELLAIYTMLFMTITGLFVIAVNSTILVMFALFGLIVFTSILTSFATILYIQAVKYQGKKRIFSRINRFLNKSFKIRNSFKFSIAFIKKINVKALRVLNFLASYKIAR